MRTSVYLAKITVAVALFGSVAAGADTARNISEYNLESGLALQGHDPVSVFPEGGSEPKPGSSKIELIYDGVTYRFANEVNREIFTENPAKYEPTYGGWCAYAMASGGKVEIQPTVYTIHGNRAHYFVNQRAKRSFDTDVNAFEENADRNWKQISGEDPRK